MARLTQKRSWFFFFVETVDLKPTVSLKYEDLILLNIEKQNEINFTELNSAIYIENNKQNKIELGDPQFPLPPDNKMVPVKLAFCVLLDLLFPKI